MREDTDRGLASLVSSLADSLGKLVSQHLALAKVELADDAKAIGTDAAKVAVFLPFVLIGYSLLMLALGIALTPWVGMAGGLAIVGGLNLVGGGLAAALAGMRLKNRKLMAGTVTELERTSARLAMTGPKLLESNHGKR